jgi:hypothetical protein
MTEYEWEVGRLPRASDARGLGGFRFRKGPIGEYVALEFPRESMTWVLNTERDREPKRSAIARFKATKSVKRKSDQT